MADPIITDHFRALVIFHGASGLPKDRFVNGWVFRDDGVGSDAATVHVTIKNMLSAFYNGTVATTARSICSYMPPQLSTMEIRTYDLGQAPPREPQISEAIGWTMGSGAPLPYENAVVMSYKSARRGPRGKGRVFLGPFTDGALEAGSGIPKVHSGLVNTIRDRALDLRDSTENATWVQLSQVEAQTNVVTGGWVDNAWDTQRRRGLAPDIRSTWGTE